MSPSRPPLLGVALRLRETLAAQNFAPPVALVYNPLDYAFEPYRRYVERFGQGKGRVLFVGMNPGPFGMAQTGIPFGEVSAVRDWMGIAAPVGRPNPEHPKRPVHGFECARSEVSGRRLWGWAARRFGSAERFFARCFVHNYCPLLFLEESGRNLTPNKLRRSEQEALEAACDAALAEALGVLQPSLIVGVGLYAEERARRVANAPVGRIPHPSPANPAANSNWQGQVETCLRRLGFRAG